MQVQVIRSQRRKKTVSARLQGDTLVVRAPAQMPEEVLTQAIYRLRQRIERRTQASSLSDDFLEERARQLNKRFFNGQLQWQSIRWVSNQESRYGSCTPASGTIRISHKIAQTPGWVMDYVLIHELAHLREANHGPGFWALVNRYPLSERARGYLMALGLEMVEDPSQSGS